MTNVNPALPGGFKDYPPEDQIRRDKAISTIKRTFRGFGFLPMDTPAVERLETLTGGEPDFNKQIFRVSQLSQDEGDADLALRFDLTVPLARFIAANPEIKKPFKRYQIGRTWRGERQQAGRYKEFLQCDVDIVGAPSVMADAEVIALMYETMKALGVSDFEIKINNRKFLNGLPEVVGFSADKVPDVLRAMDKLDRQGWEGVRDELGELGLKNDQIQKLKEFTGSASLGDAEKIAKSSNISLEGIAELKQALSYLGSLGVPENKVRVDFSIARGLGYYTGLIFETMLTKKPEVGSVFSGGRYDNLIEKFSGSKIPATGASLGFDRLFSVLDEVSSFSVDENKSVLILNFNKSCESVVLETTKKLREAGISTDIYLGQENNLKGQLAYAVSREVPIVVIIGPEEKEKGIAQVKDMRKREQKEIKQDSVVEEVKAILN